MTLSRARLTEDEIRERLAELPGWAHEDKELVKRFELPDFVEAFAFMTKVAFEAERLDHHPNWSNVYRTVEIRLSTHDRDGVTEYDFALARAIERHR